jgi:hypothetical protein
MTFGYLRNFYCYLSCFSHYTRTLIIWLDNWSTTILGESAKFTTESKLTIGNH